jgi:hypothetical protein
MNNTIEERIQAVTTTLHGALRELSALQAEVAVAKATAVRLTAPRRLVQEDGTPKRRQVGKLHRWTDAERDMVKTAVRNCDPLLPELARRLNLREDQVGPQISVLCTKDEGYEYRQRSIGAK